MSALSRPATLAVSALLSLAVASAVAQDMAGPAAIAPATAPAADPATEPATAPATAPAVATTETQPMRPTTISTRVSFNFKDATVDAFLNYFSESLGFIIIKDVRIDGRITIASPQPVTPEEAVDVINSVLRPTSTRPSRPAGCCASCLSKKRPPRISPSTSARTPPPSRTTTNISLKSFRFRSLTP